MVQAGVEHGKLEKTVKTILAEFEKIRRVKVSAEELHKAKSCMKGTMTLVLETSDHVAENAATSIINLGRVRPLEEIIKGIEKVTATDIQKVSKDIFQTGKLNLAIIGPHTNGEHLRSFLQL